MELVTIKLHNMQQSDRVESQITLDDDYNVPDYRPDIVKMIKKQGELKLDEIRPAQGAVFIKGKLIFKVLYRSDQETGKISCLKGELPFQEKINMNGISEYDPVRVSGEIEDLTVGVIHSRKLNIRAVIVLFAAAEVSSVQEVTGGIAYADGCMQLQKEMTVSEQLLHKHDICRQKNEMILPSSKPNIREILWKSVELRNVGTRLDKDGLYLNGEILLSILYQEEEELDRIQWYETTMPLECKVELGMENILSEKEIFYKLRLEDIIKELEVKPDYDGEERMLILDMQIPVYIRVWKESKIQLLKDVYSLNCNLKPEYGKVILQHLLIKNDASCKITEQMELEENQEKILQICSCEGKARLDRTERKATGLYVEGTLEVSMLYITTDDQMPVGSAYKLFPFEQLIELPSTELPIRLEQECNVVQLSASMLDQNHAEIKSVIGVNILAFSENECEHITNIEEEELDMEKLQQMPGLIGYVVKNGDILWDIAKEYHTTTQAIMETNQKKSEELQIGEKLLIMKEINDKK